MKGTPHGALLALFLVPNFAAAAAETPLSLGEALRTAEQHNPELLAQRARSAAEAERTAAARRARWPRLSLVTGWSRTDFPSMVFGQKLNAGEFEQADFAIDSLNDPGGLSHQTTTLAAELPVDLFGRLDALTRAQASAELASGDATEESLLDLRLRVTEAYRRAAVAHRLVEATERAVAAARAREADLEARVEEGAALNADLLRIRGRRRQREADLADRRADAAIAAAVLSRVLGAEAGVFYRPTEAPAAPEPLEGDAAQWVSRALAARPRLRAAARGVESREWTLRAEERTGRPDLAAWGQVQDDRSRFGGGRQSTAFGVMVRWTALDGTRGKRVAAAAAEARAAALDEQAARDQIRLDVETAWLRARAARERHAAAAGGAEEAREALRVVRERRQQGMATLSDELETEAASLAAEIEEIRAASDAAIADATLERSAATWPGRPGASAGSR
jgi:outer membrane protein TolC